MKADPCPDSCPMEMTMTDPGNTGVIITNAENPNCPVGDQCVEFSLDHNSLHGVYDLSGSNPPYMDFDDIGI